MNAEAYPHIAMLIGGGGHIMVGVVKPIDGAAIAYDGKTAVAMLRRQPDETVELLLARLDAAIETARRTGQRLDEVNPP
jgi:hypothetical protein